MVAGQTRDQLCCHCLSCCGDWRDGEAIISPITTGRLALRAHSGGVDACPWRVRWMASWRAHPCPYMANTNGPLKSGPCAVDHMSTPHVYIRISHDVRRAFTCVERDLALTCRTLLLVDVHSRRGEKCWQDVWLRDLHTCDGARASAVSSCAGGCMS